MAADGHRRSPTACCSTERAQARSTQWAIRARSGAQPVQMIAVLGAVDAALNVKTARRPGYRNSHERAPIRYRASASYITGAHAFKVGFGNTTGYLRPQRIYDINPRLPVQQRRAEPGHLRALPTMFRVDARPSNGRLRAGSLDRRSPDAATSGCATTTSRTSFPAQDMGPRRWRRIGTSVREDGRGFVATTSLRSWAPPTICSATAGRR